MKFADAVFRPGFTSVIDTHCHYNLEPLYESWQEHWRAAQAKNVQFSWIPGTTLETSRRAILLANQVSEFQAFVGVHPGEIEENEFDLETTLRQFRALFAQYKNAAKPIMGVGEIGLDYFRLEPGDLHSRQEQRTWLRAQLELAHEWKVPVILHVRDKEVPEEETPENAYWDTVRIVREMGMPSDFTMHCVSGPIAYVQAMVKMGAYAGFDGNITYPNAHHIRTLWTHVPENRRLLETDAPFLPPQGYRGKVCEPWMVTETAQWVRENLMI